MGAFSAEFDFLNLTLELLGEVGKSSAGVGVEFMHSGLDLADADINFFSMLIDCSDHVGRGHRSFGGAGGVGDSGLLESALSRARNLFGYGTSDLYELAGSH